MNKSCKSCLWVASNPQTNTGTLPRCQLGFGLNSAIKQAERLQPEARFNIPLPDSEYMFHHVAEIDQEYLDGLDCEVEGGIFVDEILASLQEWLDAQPKCTRRPRLTANLRNWIRAKRIPPRRRFTEIRPMGLNAIITITARKFAAECNDYQFDTRFELERGCYSRCIWRKTCTNYDEKFQDQFIPEEDRFWLM